MYGNILLLAYSVGIGLGLVWQKSVIIAMCFVCACIGVLVWNRTYRFRWFCSGVLLLCVGYWFGLAQLEKWNTLPEEYDVVGKAWVSTVPDTSDTDMSTVLRFLHCDGDICPRHDVLIRLPAYEHLQYGQVLDIECTLKNPKSRTESFDYRMYLAMRGIQYICTPHQWKKTDEQQGLLIMRTLFSMRQKFETRIDTLVPYPESGLIKGLLFGGGSYLTKDTQTLFSKTGLSHIVAVSGANVVIVAEAFFYGALLLGLWRKQALLVSGFGVLVFVLIVGASASAVRAGIMCELVIVASLVSRKASGLRLWSVTLAVMLTFQPLSLEYDIGFQLSFMATLGLLVCSTWSRTVLQSIASTALRFFVEIILLSICVESFVLPIVFYHFHVFSLVSILANVLVLPCITLAMLLGTVTLIMSYISFSLAHLCGISAYAVLHYMMSTVEIIGNLPFATIPIEPFGSLHVVGWYGILSGLLIACRKHVV